jgi:hypothetical protein
MHLEMLAGCKFEAVMNCEIIEKQKVVMVLKNLIRYMLIYTDEYYLRKKDI